MMGGPSLMVQVTCDGYQLSDIIASRGDKCGYGRTARISDKHDFTGAEAIFENADRTVHRVDHLGRKPCIRPVALTAGFAS